MLTVGLRDLIGHEPLMEQNGATFLLRCGGDARMAFCMQPVQVSSIESGGALSLPSMKL